MDGVVQEARRADSDTGTVFGGGQRASGPRGSDGRNIGTLGGSEPHAGLRFDRSVPLGGYAWWYIDALSDDGAFGLTLIAFLGSVFSPYYAWARGRGPANPLNHCALNVALYGPRGGRWAMTERGMCQVSRYASLLSIGPSAMSWRGDSLIVQVDERCAPLPRRLKGEIRLDPASLTEHSYFLDGAGRHRWTPYAPEGRISVRFSEPDLTWSGTAYFDSNCGSEPLEDAFVDWTWSRAHAAARTIVLYDVNARDGSEGSLGLEFSAQGVGRPIELPPLADLPRSGWRVARRTRADSVDGARVARTLEDAPFYSRSLLRTQLFGEACHAVHESLDLDRFRSRWVQCLLPFRMPRIAG